MASDLVKHRDAIFYLCH